MPVSDRTELNGSDKERFVLLRRNAADLPGQNLFPDAHINVGVDSLVEVDVGDFRASEKPSDCFPRHGRGGGLQNRNE